MAELSELPDDEEDLQQCEACEKQFPVESMTLMEECWFCPQCTEEWRAEFKQCSHSWEPHTNTMGDAGQYCTRCAGFVADADFASLGLTHPAALKATE